MADSKLSKVSDSSLLIAAMSYRVKYRKLDSDGRPIKLHLRVEGCGVHKMNRGGVYPAGVACMRLCDEVLRAGFLKEEVNHAGVAVEEIPIAEVRRRIGEGLVSASVYNAAQCALDELLARCFEPPYGDVRHFFVAQPYAVSPASISHSGQMGYASLRGAEPHLLR